MTMTALTLFRDHQPTAKDGAPAPDRVLTGAPRTRTINYSSSLEGTVLSGLWEATPGSWRVTYTKWEFCHVISGEGSLEDRTGTVRQIGPGDAFVIEPGFDGIWTVHETMTKHYVIIKPPIGTLS
jgi:uncharacterized protein